MKINVARDFSPVPSGRFASDGPDSGERFREDFLFPAIQRGEEVEIEIDDAAGYGSSFLEEAFGGLIRVKRIDPNEAKRLIKIISSDPEFEIYVDLIFKFIDEAAAE